MTSETTSARFYTRWAGLYDRLATGAPFVGPLRTATADALALDPGDAAVEMGCGTGANLPYLRERVGPSGTVVGVDFSAGVLARARDRVARAGWGNVHLVRADATRPPFPTTGPAVDPDGTPDGGVADPAVDPDAVLATFVSGMLADPAATVRRWADLVGAGGRLCLLDLARTTAPRARALNPLFAAFVRAGSPPGTGSRGRRLVRILDERVRDAHHALHEVCGEATTERRLAGFARLTSGTV